MVIAAFIGSLFAETADEAYARLSSYRSVWDTNAWAYAKLAAIGEDPAVAEAKARWFIDVLAFPDVTETNRLDEVLRAKRNIISWNAGSHGVESNTNCWYAVADYIARLKSVADPGWQDLENDNYVNAVNDFRRKSLDAYVRQHTNFVAEVNLTNLFYHGWRVMFKNKWNREVGLKYALDNAKQAMKERFWLFGAKDLPADVKAVCRSNIVERAHLTPEEEHDIFEDIPYWFRRLGIKHK